MEEKLQIKNMVCPRCIMVVEEQLRRLGIEPLRVTLGEVVLRETLTAGQKEELAAVLVPLGFELLDDRRMQLIEKVKNAVVELVHRDNCTLRTNLSDYIASRVNHDYNSLSALFSETTGTTIEKYFIAQKTERVKELLVYGELSLSEIADLLGYSSVAHLSSQFKKVTGLTPSYFRRMKEKRRQSLDKV